MEIPWTYRFNRSQKGSGKSEQRNYQVVVDADDEIRLSLSEIVKSNQPGIRRTAEQIAQSLYEFGRGYHLEEILEKNNINKENIVFHTTASTIQRYYSKQTLITDTRLVNGIFLWLLQNYSEIIRPKMEWKALVSKETFVKSARNILKRDEYDFGQKEARALRGVYRLYRRHFLDPLNQTMVCKLTVGRDSKNPYDCDLEMIYTDKVSEVSETRHEVAFGKIVPYAGRAMSLMSLGENGSIMVHYDVMREQIESKNIAHLEGTMIISTPHEWSCAYPFFAHRFEGEFPVGVFNNSHVDEISGLPLLPERYIERFIQGSVHFQRRAPYQLPQPKF
jgi:hypothetical protein